MALRSKQTKAEALQRQRLLSAQRDRRRPSVTRAPPPSFRHTLQGEPAQALDQPQVRSKPAARRKRVVRQAAVQPVPTPPEELKAKQLLLQPEHVPGMGSFAKKVAKHKVSRENWRDAIPLHPSSVAASSSGVDEQRQEAIRKWHEWKEAVAKDQERFDRPEEQPDPEVGFLPAKYVVGRGMLDHLAGCTGAICCACDRMLQPLLAQPVDNIQC